MTSYWFCMLIAVVWFIFGFTSKTQADKNFGYLSSSVFVAAAIIVSEIDKIPTS